MVNDHCLYHVFIVYPIYEMENKIHVPNHRRDIVDHCLYHVFIMSLSCLYHVFTGESQIGSSSQQLGKIKTFQTTNQFIIVYRGFSVIGFGRLTCENLQVESCGIQWERVSIPMRPTRNEESNNGGRLETLVTLW